MTTPSLEPAPEPSPSVAPAPELSRSAPDPAPFDTPRPEPVVPQPVHRASRGAGGSARIVNVALGAALLVAAAGVAFAAGRATAPVSAAGTTGTLPGVTDRLGGGNVQGDGTTPGGVAGRGPLGGLAGGMTVQGTVESVAADSVTIKTSSGTTVTVGLDADTTYHQQADATASDVEAGETVILQLSGGFRPAASPGASPGTGGTSGSTSLGTASDVTVVP
jgi:hypothetical protein